MLIDIQYRPAQSLARIELDANEGVVAEAGAMVAMSTNVEITTESGGLFKGLRRWFGGESFFQNTFTARNAPGEVLLAHSLPGDMAVLQLHGQSYLLQSSSFIAASIGVNVETKIGGFKSFFAGEGAFVMRASSEKGGQLVLGAFGGIEPLDCDGTLVIDTGHLVAWDESLKYTVEKSAKGWIASYLSGEGMVCRFTGHGRIWIQTRNPSEYGGAIGALLPARKG